MNDAFDLTASLFACPACIFWYLRENLSFAMLEAPRRCQAVLATCRTFLTRDDAIAKLKEHEADLRQLGVELLYLFGATARSDAREDSDVDLFSITRVVSSGFTT